MPAGVQFPDAPVEFLRERADLWLANSFDHLRGAERGNQFFAALGRVRATATDAQLPATRIGTVTDLVAKASATDRFYALVIAAFAGTALLLASFGLYGVMASLVEQRRREIGIRVAVGGTPGAIRWLVMREGLLVTAAGLASGSIAAFASSRILAGLLFGVRPSDPLTYGGIATLILLVTAAAAYAPLRRATRVDPIEALRA